jgi:hypothetical protein
MSDSLEFLSRFPDHEVVIGPLQRSEALFMYSTILVLRPKRIVELGFYKGDSCCALAAAAKEMNRLTKDPKNHATVESYDIKVNVDDVRFIQEKYPGTRIEVMDQRDIHKIEGPEIDFLFIDAAHNLQINQDTWRNIESKLSLNAVVMVHDTGLWVNEHRPSNIGRQGCDGVIRGAITGCFHQPDEVEFVKWIVNMYPLWIKMDFMSVNTFRHGFTLLQRSLIV